MFFRFSKRCLTIVLLVLFIPFLVFSTSIKDVMPNLSEAQIEKLYAGKLVKGESFDEDVMVLVPQGTVASQHLQNSLQMPNSFSVVSLTYVPYPEHVKNMNEQERQVYIFNTMRSISTQEGITYISHRAGNKPRVLIEKSWYLEEPKGRNSIPDPVSDIVPSTAEYVVFQKDSTFGSNVYSHQYQTTETEIFVNVKNLETIRVYGIFKAVGKDKLAIAMATNQLDDGLLLSAMATIEDRKPVINLLGYKVDLPSSFTRRTTALGEWFVARLNQ